MNPFKSMTFRFTLAMAVLLGVPLWAGAETRFLIPEIQFGSRVDTTLVISNSSDRTESLTVWVFRRNGQALGQFQTYTAAHSSKSLALSEMLGRPTETTSGWLAAFGEENIQIAYLLPGPNPTSREAERAPSREVLVSLFETRGDALRITNVSGYKNQVVLRTKDDAHRVLATRIVTVNSYGQTDVALDDLKNAAFVELQGQSDLLASITQRTSAEAVLRRVKEEHRLSLVIDSRIPVGAYQLLIHFDPQAWKISADEIEGGTVAGFSSKPLSINVDADKGELRIASFQLGHSPLGVIEIASIRVRPLRPADLSFAIDPEEISGLTGESLLPSMPSVGLFVTTTQIQ
jgi:hypothetical protein